MKKKSRIIITCCWVLSLLIGGLLNASLWSQNWPIYKGNVFFTGNNDAISPIGKDIVWKVKTDGMANSPIVSEGRVYFSTRGGFLYAAKESSGKVIFKTKLYSSAFRPLVLSGEYLIASDFQWLYCFDKKTGQIIWARKDKDHGLYASPTIYNQNIYYGSRKQFFAKNIQNGHELWSQKKITSWGGFPYIYGDKLIYLSKNIQSKKNNLFFLKTSTGKILWEKPLPYAIKIISPVVYQKRIYAVIASNCFQLDSQTGDILTQQDYEDYIIGQVAFSEKNIILPMRNGNLAISDVFSLKRQKTIKTGFSSAPHFILIGNEIYTAGIIKTKEGNLNYIKGFDFKTGEMIYQLSIPKKKSISGLIASNGRLFVSTEDSVLAIGKNNKIIVDAKPPLNKQKKDMDGDGKVKIILVLKDQKTGENLSGKFEILTRNQNGEVIDKQTLDFKKEEQSKVISVPENGTTEIIGSSDDYLANKTVLNEKQKKQKTEKKGKVNLGKIKDGQIIQVNHIGFAYNKSTLTTQSFNILNKIKDSLLQKPHLKIEIVGHTDNIGSENYNLKLSENRADTVKEYLVKQGIFQERIITKGYGESKPIASNNLEEGREKNRRTEFRIFK